MIISDRDSVKWWAMRVSYNQGLRAKHELNGLGIENFLPMTSKIIMRGERKVKVLIPAIQNLIFIRTTFNRLEEYHDSTQLPVRYIMDRATDSPIFVPERQMDSFIAVAGHPDERVIYLAPSTESLKKGDLVRITGGLFRGAEGYFIRLKGDRRVVVNIPGVAAVATTFVHPSLIERIK